MARKSFKVAGRMFFLAAVSLFVMISGCGGDDAESGSGGNANGRSPAPLEYPSSLSADSSPEQVATVLIKALDEKDKGTLLGLVATKAASAKIDAIYRKYGRSKKTDPVKTAGLTVVGWSSSYAFFQNGQTTTTRQVIEGDNAVVFANGTRPDGEPATLKIKLLREDGHWKVRAGLKSLPE